MAIQNLAEATKGISDTMTEGIVETIVTTNPIYDSIPFKSYTGSALAIRKEVTMGNSGFYDIGDTLVSRTPSTTDYDYYRATKIIGEVEMDDLVQASSNDTSLAIEIESKAKSVSRDFQSGMVNGSGTAPQMHSLKSLCATSQTIEISENGGEITFEKMDEAIALVKAKDGEVDFIVGNATSFLRYKAFLRANSVNPADMIMKTTLGRTISSYENIPFYVMDYIPNNEVQGTSTDCTSLYFGCFDDGTGKVGVTAITPAHLPAGIHVKNVGTSSTKDEELFRIKFYVNIVIGSVLGLSRLKGIRKS
jgi:hypothetical protein